MVRKMSSEIDESQVYALKTQALEKKIPHRSVVDDEGSHQNDSRQTNHRAIVTEY